MKKQSKASRLDESLGMRRGKESKMKQSLMDRRDESKNMIKEIGKVKKTPPKGLTKHLTGKDKPKAMKSK